MNHNDRKPQNSKADCIANLCHRNTDFWETCTSVDGFFSVQICRANLSKTGLEKQFVPGRSPLQEASSLFFNDYPVSLIFFLTYLSNKANCEAVELQKDTENRNVGEFLNFQ